MELFFTAIILTLAYKFFIASALITQSNKYSSRAHDAANHRYNHWRISHTNCGRSPRNSILLFIIPKGNMENEGEKLVENLEGISKYILNGKPSNPGWKSSNAVDELTEWAISNEANRPIICEYEPDGLWLWSKWRGTALSITYIPVLINLALGIGVDRWVHWNSESTWALLAVPPESDPLIQQLVGMKILWEYQLTLCTFILAFFTSQAYTHWQNVYFTTRKIQGRINDMCMLLTIAAKRSTVIEKSTTTGYDKEAEELVQTCTRLLRLSHTFFWASIKTSSNGVSDGGVLDGDENDDLPKSERLNDAIGPVLLSPLGLKRLVDANELTREERKGLMYSGLPPSQYAYVLLEWVGLYSIEGLRDGTIQGGNGVEDQIMKRLTDIRAEYFNIGDLAAGRMPVAYVQLVQIIVDTLVWMSPFSLYPGLGSLSIPLVGLLTLFFKGLLELSKSFLDPFGNEGYPGQNIRVDVLVSELNFGAASRWFQAGNALPVRKDPFS